MKRVLVTGASGFIGSRLVERLLLEEQVDVVPFIHQYRNASRLARFPLRLACGDVTDRAAIRAAATSCDAIVHCAVSFRNTAKRNRQITVEGAANVCAAAEELKIRRVVHLSTFSVYGVTPPGVFNESGRADPGGDAYGTSKLEAEAVVLKHQQRGLSAIILQPTIVYGPWSFWSSQTSAMAAQGTVLLPNGGQGLCNAVYVDDVVDAIILALRKGEVSAGPLLISAEKPVTWKEFYAAHCLDEWNSIIRDLPAEEVQALRRRSTLVGQWKAAMPQMFRYMKKVAGEMPGARQFYYQNKSRVDSILRINGRSGHSVKALARVARAEPTIPDLVHFPLLESKTSVSVENAGNELGYRPRFDLSAGGGLIREWLRWCARK